MIYEKKEFTLKNGLKIELKTPEKEDAEELLVAIRKIAGQTPFLLSSVEDYSSMTKESEEQLIENLRLGNSYMIGVFHEGKIIGHCGLSFNRHVKDRHRCSVGIGIDENYWGMGIGSLLFDELIKIAENADGVEQMELGVFANNPRAIALYTKKGFVQTGQVLRAAKFKDGSYTDELLMTKILK